MTVRVPTPRQNTGSASCVPRRVLLVSPNWPPMAFPDLHRLRMALPYFRENGWEPAVLCIDPAHRSGVRDDALAAMLPADVPVHRVRPLPSWITDPLRVSGLALRALPGLARAGDAMIRDLGIDVVYFSTTLSEVMALGRYWKARHGVPYVVDWQDPWYGDYYRQPGAPRPPGGRLRYAIANGVARHLEPFVLRGAAQVIAVSAAYPRALRARYPWLEGDRCCVIPFGASPEDLRAAARPEISQRVFTPGDGCVHWVYAGRVGEDMTPAISALLSAMASARRAGAGWLDRVRLHVVGGSYDPDGAGRGPVTRMSEAFGVADLVHEDRTRLPYLEALRCLRDADALVMFGSDDPGYAPSKLFTYVLAGKPLLALLHEGSDAVGVLRRARAGTVVTFTGHERPAAVADRVRSAWLRPEGPPEGASDGEGVTEFTAPALTRLQCARLDRAHAMARRGLEA